MSNMEKFGISIMLWDTHPSHGDSVRTFFYTDGIKSMLNKLSAPVSNTVCTAVHYILDHQRDKDVCCGSKS